MGVISDAMKAAREAVLCGKKMFVLCGRTFCLVEVVPGEYVVECDNRNAGIRVYDDGVSVRAEMM